MSNGYFKVEMPKNEPVKAYLPGSPERASLKKELERQSAQVVQVQSVIFCGQFNTCPSVPLPTPAFALV